jgi:DNA-binding beta-propeller fold protein YncE
MMKRIGKVLVGASLLGLGIACSAPPQPAATPASGGGSSAPNNLPMSTENMVPMFEVDPFFPKNVGNHGLMGPIIGVDVDSTDTVWIVHRNTPNQFVATTEIGAAQNPPLSECCRPAPPVLAFDQQGNLKYSWGGNGTETGGYVWPESNHGITIDHKDNVWIGGNGGPDSHVLKFTKDGKFLAQYGKPGARQVGKGKDGEPVFKRNSSDPESFGRVAKIGIDASANEAYIADGYFNRRIAVLDADTGKIKRFWGAFGKPPDDGDLPRYTAGEPSQQTFRGPVHCSEISKDGLVYVCDRNADRIQIFRKDGTFVSEHLIAPATLSQGSTWDIDFSHDPEQRFLYLADGQNMKVYIIERKTMKTLTAFGDGGRQPGMFFAVHSIAVDSKGNIYTTETYEGSRLQRFLFKGMGPVPAGAEGEKSQGVLWPANKR